MNLSSHIKTYKYFELRVYLAFVCYSRATGPQQKGITVLNIHATFPSIFSKKTCITRGLANQMLQIKQNSGNLVPIQEAFKKMHLQEILFGGYLF